MKEMETIKISEIEYVRKDQLSTKAESTDGMKFVIVRANRSGVFNGYLKKREGREVTLVNARRMWKWIGATLSECAQSGTPEPENNKWPEAVDEVLVLDAIEILDVTKKAKESFDKVSVWKR